MPDLMPLQLLLATFAGWTNRHQAQVIDYLVEENRVLKEQLRGRRLRLTDSQRRRLAAKGKPLGRRLLQSIATIVTPDTILRWHKRLIAAKWTHLRPRVGRPGLMRHIRSLIVRMAEDNPSWGYARIQGTLEHVGSQGRAQHCRENAARARHQARAGPPHQLAQLSPSPCRCPGCGGLLHDGGLDGTGPRHPLHPVRHRPGEPGRPHRRDHAEP
jgi:hypothetical protein